MSFPSWQLLGMCLAALLSCAAAARRTSARAARGHGRGQNHAAARHAAGRVTSAPAFSEGVLDDLYAKAVVFDDGKTKVAMVTCDLIGLPRPVVVEARRIIGEETGIPADNVMISATHTHTAPTVLGLSALGDLAAGGSKLSREYAEQLPKSIARAVRQGRRPADAGAHRLRHAPASRIFPSFADSG